MKTFTTTPPPALAQKPPRLENSVRVLPESLTAIHGANADVVFWIEPSKNPNDPYVTVHFDYLRKRENLNEISDERKN